MSDPLWTPEQPYHAYFEADATPHSGGWVVEYGPTEEWVAVVMTALDAGICTRALNAAFVLMPDEDPSEYLTRANSAQGETWADYMKRTADCVRTEIE